MITQGPADPARSYCFSCGLLRPKAREEMMGWGEGCQQDEGRR